MGFSGKERNILKGFRSQEFIDNFNIESIEMSKVHLKLLNNFREDLNFSQNIYRNPFKKEPQFMDFFQCLTGYYFFSINKHLIRISDKQQNMRFTELNIT